jgi:hypothetical protein
MARALNPHRSNVPGGRHYQLVRFLCCCGALFRVRHECCKPRVSVERFQVSIFIHTQSGRGV